ncbi:MAG: ribose ABC transporter permease, partial [Planctomycetes bacterium]|nr:ribose ABC transporter permease [Planctomycetota bacterium]
MSHDVAAQLSPSVLQSVAARLKRSPLLLPLVGLIVVSTVMAFASDNFFSIDNIVNVLRQQSIIGILAIGMTFVILTGGIDLSVGAVMALCGTLGAGVMVNMGLPGGVGLLAMIVVGILFGLFNGLLVAWGKMPAIIVTLATMLIARGLGLVYSGGYPVSGLPGWISWFGI